MRKSMAPLVVAIFILSGAAGLIYEIVWSRQLVLVFGNTTQAVSTILAGFFGGMAIGAAVGGRVADRVRSPLRMYGILEIILVGVVLATPLTFELIREAYRGLYPSMVGTPWLAIVRLLLALLALAPATILMGATFPTLVRQLSRISSLSESFGRLYSANMLGAILGTLVAGLVLVEVLGLTGALVVGAVCSGIAGVIAIVLSRSDDSAGSTAKLSGSRGPSSSLSIPVGSIALPLAIAFVSGLTSLGYQVTWTRLLASGSGGYTYVFTIILAMFLIGLALGAATFNVIRPRITDPVKVLVVTQLAVAVLAIAGLVLVLSRPDPPQAGDALGSVGSLFLASLIVVVPTTTVMGIAFPTASTLLRDRADEAGSESGALLASNTTGAIIGSVVFPFFLMPLSGSPTIVVVLAIVNVLTAIGLALITHPVRPRWAVLGAVVMVAIVVVASRPGAVAQPNEAFISASGGELFASTEDEIASVQAGQRSVTPELWVAGTSMTLLTVDAKLMPILPLIARPASERALVVAFGMGTSFRSALIAGMRTDVVELVPSVLDMFGFYYDDAEAVLADPDGRVVVADGRNHLELSDERFDIIVTDPPPPIESSGASVISSKEYYEAGRDHLAAGGVMMQWVPFGAPEPEFKEHLRTFAAVYPHTMVVRGAGGYGVYMLGSADPLALDPAAIRDVLERPGVLDDVSTAYDSPVTTVDAWIDVIEAQTWLPDAAAVAAYVGDGPLITDDRPLPEYFLIRRLTDGIEDR